MKFAKYHALGNDYIVIDPAEIDSELTPSQINKLGLCDGEIAIHMPGGRIDVAITEDFYVRMTGPVTRIADGTMTTEMFTGAA